MCNWQFPIAGLEVLHLDIDVAVQADDHKLELVELDVWLDQSKLPTGYQCPDMSHNFTSLLETTNLLKPLHQDTHCTSNDKSMEDQRVRAYSVGDYLDTRQKSLGSLNRFHVNNLDFQ